MLLRPFAILIPLLLAACNAATTGSSDRPVTSGAAAPGVLQTYAGVTFTPPQGANTLQCREPQIPEYRWSWACTMEKAGRIVRIEFWRDRETDEDEMRNWLTRYFFRPSTANYSNNIAFDAGNTVPVALPDGRTLTATFGRGRQLSTGDHSHRIAILIVPASYNSAGKTMTILFGRNQWAAPPVTQAEIQSFLDGMRFPASGDS